MAKIKLQEETKELIQTTSKLLRAASKTRKNADMLAIAIDKVGRSFINEENLKLEEERRKQAKELENKHMPAYTMLDDETLAQKKAIEAEKIKKLDEAKKDQLDKENSTNTVANNQSGTNPALEGKQFNRPSNTYNNNRPYPANNNQQGYTNNNRPRTGYQGAPRQGFQAGGAPRQGFQAGSAPRQGFQAGSAPRQGFQAGGAPRQGFQAGGAPRQGGYTQNRTGNSNYSNNNYNRSNNSGGYNNNSQGGYNKSQDNGSSYGNRNMANSKPAKPKVDILIPAEKERSSNYDPNKKNYERRSNNMDYNKNRSKRIKTNFRGYDDEIVRGGRRARAKKKVSVQQLMEPIKIDEAVMTTELITVRDLSAKIGKPANGILKQLLILGVFANINNELDFDTASVVASELGVSLTLKLEKTAEEKLTDVDIDDNDENMVSRPPVITIMGHVDHGKTSLLDYIRNSHVTSGEAGGITQHIGAYTVDIKNRKITFLDTPGHEAFTSMRARGAQATDIAIIVVAADDGVMPQTIEAINHSKAAKVPIIIAINKMDVPGANPDRVKQDLTNYELVPEEWGGDIIMVPVSAITGEGVDKLLEMILLEADMQEYKANPDRLAKGVIIEAKLDKSRGPLATVLLKTGTLRVGDSIVAGTASGHVRAMVNDKNERVSSAGPSMPVEISGFNEVPEAGDFMNVVEDDKLAKTVAEERKDKEKAVRQQSGTKVSLDNLFSQIDQGKLMKLNLIIKADVQGSVEAVKQAMEKLSTEEVKVRVLHSGVGAVTKDDVNLASAFDAIIIGFNIRPNSNAREMATHEGVDIRLYRVIYKAIEDVEKAMNGLLEPEYKEVILGHAEVRSTFNITGTGTVAGSYVIDGKMQRNAKIRLLRDNVVVFEGELSSLRRFKNDAKEVASNYECGISLAGYNDIKENDVFECFIMEEIER